LSVYTLDSRITRSSKDNSSDSFEALVSANRVPDAAVLRAPRIRHLVADIPQLREKPRAQTLVQEFDWATLKRLRSEADAAMNQLQVHEPEALK
jgi:hypothetical protein